MTLNTDKIRLALTAFVAFGLLASTDQYARADLDDNLVAYWSFDDPGDPGHDDPETGNEAANRRYYSFGISPTL